VLAEPVPQKERADIRTQNYLDRNNIAAVRLAGLQDELNLSGTEYQTTVSILFVGYILMQGEYVLIA
jgi:hypothetical protein